MEFAPWFRWVRFYSTWSLALTTTLHLLFARSRAPPRDPLVERDQLDVALEFASITARRYLQGVGDAHVLNPDTEGATHRSSSGEGTPRAGPKSAPAPLSTPRSSRTSRRRWTITLPWCECGADPRIRPAEPGLRRARPLAAPPRIESFM